MLTLLTLCCLSYYLRASRHVLVPVLITVLSLYSLLVLLACLTSGAHLYLMFYSSVATYPSHTLEIALSLCGFAMVLPVALIYVLAVTARVRHQPLVAGSAASF